jgi:hypothetical protein
MAPQHSTTDPFAGGAQTFTNALPENLTDANLGATRSLTFHDLLASEREQVAKLETLLLLLREGLIFVVGHDPLAQPQVPSSADTQPEEPGIVKRTHDVQRIVHGYLDDCDGYARSLLATLGVDASHQDGCVVRVR